MYDFMSEELKETYNSINQQLADIVTKTYSYLPKVLNLQARDVLNGKDNALHIPDTKYETTEITNLIIYLVENRVVAEFNSYKFACPLVDLEMKVFLSHVAYYTCLKILRGKSDLVAHRLIYGVQDMFIENPDGEDFVVCVFPFVEDEEYMYPKRTLILNTSYDIVMVPENQDMTYIEILDEVDCILANITSLLRIALVKDIKNKLGIECIPDEKITPEISGILDRFIVNVSHDDLYVTTDIYKGSTIVLAETGYSRDKQLEIFRTSDSLTTDNIVNYKAIMKSMEMTKVED